MTTISGNAAPSALMTAMNPAKPGAVEAEGSLAAQDRFMKLLITQMKNQDPLNPLDNAQVTSQLAQLSTVSGIDKLNATMNALMGSFQANQSLQAAGMIGHAVLVPGNSVALVESKALLGVEVTEPADTLELTIRDGNGKAIRKMDLGAQQPGVYPLHWDGKTDSGATAADGKYTFEVAATRGSEKSKAAPLSFGEVTSVTTGAQGVKLDLRNFGAASLADIRQIL
jgi:flagellar basal-body rod modification protein FlgD